MPHRTSKKGKLRIDWRRPEIGRIALSSGTTLKTEYRKRGQMLDRLYERGRFDPLEAIKERTYTITEVYAHYREDRLNELTDVLQHPFWTNVGRWSGKAHPNSTRGCHHIAFQQLKRLDVVPATAKIRDLAAVNWHKLKRVWPYSASSWNHVCKATSKFLSDHLGDVHHPFRRQMFENNSKTGTVAFSKAKEIGRVPDLSPAVFRDLINYLLDYVQPAIMCLELTGLRIGEYLSPETQYLQYRCARHQDG